MNEKIMPKKQQFLRSFSEHVIKEACDPITPFLRKENMKKKNDIERKKQYLEDHIPVDSIGLYGSYARNDFDEKMWVYPDFPKAH